MSFCFYKNRMNCRKYAIKQTAGPDEHKPGKYKGIKMPMQRILENHIQVYQISLKVPTCIKWFSILIRLKTRALLDLSDLSVKMLIRGMRSETKVAQATKLSCCSRLAQHSDELQASPHGL